MEEEVIITYSYSNNDLVRYVSLVKNKEGKYGIRKIEKVKFNCRGVEENIITFSWFDDEDKALLEFNRVNKLYRSLLLKDEKIIQ